MLLRDEDTGAFREWLLPKLDQICDAEGDVLADYVTALVTANNTERGLKKHCLDSLQDFLQDNTAPFVDELVKAIRTKPYISRAPAKAKVIGKKSQSPSDSRLGPIPSVAGTPNALKTPPPPYNAAPTGPSATSTTSSHALPKAGKRKRKQERRDAEASEARDGGDSHYDAGSNGHRPVKQPTGRGGFKTLRGGAGAFVPRNASPGLPTIPLIPGFAPMPILPGFAPMSAPGFAPMAHMPNMLNMPNMPPPPPGPMPFEMISNPMAFLSMMTAMGANTGVIPPLPQANAQGRSASGRPRVGKCYNYHEKGFCALGDLCAFEHEDAGDAPKDVPQYDPEQPLLGKNRAHYSGGKGVNSRAPFSMLGPSYDRTDNTLVVEQIPAEKLSDKDVRAFFSEFGTIVEVQVQALKRLAIVKFEDNAAATRAYKSPKAVFENRFVKVYWFKDSNEGYSGAFYGDVEMGDIDDFYKQDEPLDREEIAKRQAEAQKAFEERRKKHEESEARSADIERQIKEKEAEMKEIKQQIAELTGDDNDALNEKYSRELATLAAEAKDLFAQKEPLSSGGRGRSYPPRGTYRGRGFGRGRGRGAFPFPNNRSSVKRLDNRPRRLAVSGITKDTPRDEALRQYLMNIPECTSIESHPEQPDTLVLTFELRYQAETFLDNSRQIPDVGELELAWVSNDAFGGLPASTTTKESDAAANNGLEFDDSANDHDDNDDSSVTAEEQLKFEADEDDYAADLDLDVADEVDDFL